MSGNFNVLPSGATTLSVMDTLHNDIRHNKTLFYAEFRDYLNVMLSVIMLNVIMLNVIMLNVIMLNVIKLNGIMLSVVAPSHPG